MKYIGKVGDQFIQLEKPDEPETNGVGIIIYSVLAGALLMLLACLTILL